jgi:hypothetical protein
MLVSGADPHTGPGDRISSGEGGAAGQNGYAGMGYDGGRNGNELQETVNLFQHTNSSSLRVSKSSKKSIVSEPMPGADGKRGTFKIGLVDSNGMTTFYPGYQDICLTTTQEDKLSQLPDTEDCPTFEFGETVVISQCQVANFGKMPTPSKQRVLIRMKKDAKNLTVHKDNLFLPTESPVGPGERGLANEGRISFTAAAPDIDKLGDDFGPRRMEGTKEFQAFQLGPENDPELWPPPSDFMVEYKHFDQSGGARVMLAYPVENVSGVTGLGILSCGESTLIRIGLMNISKKALGHKSETKRKLQVHFFLSKDSDHKLGLKDVELFKTSGKHVTLDPNNFAEKKKMNGHVVKVKDLPAQSETHIEHILKIASTASPYDKAKIQVAIFLQGIPELRAGGKTKKHSTLLLIQKRKFVVSCQPAYKPDPTAQVVLVTSASTTRAQYTAWLSVLNDKLGLAAEVYSMSIYSHLSPSEFVDFLDDGGARQKETLRNLFASKLIIVLNEPFVPLTDGSSDKLSRPSAFLTNTSDFNPGTKWLIVDCDLQSVQHLSPAGSCMLSVYSKDEEVEETELDNMDATEADLAEVSPTFNSNQSKSNSFEMYQDWMIESLERERATGFSSDTALRPGYNVIDINCNMRRQPDSGMTNRILKSRAVELQKWLGHHDSIRNYAIEILPASQQSSPATWRVGFLRVYRGALRSDNSIVLVDQRAASHSLSSAESIGSKSMLYSIVSALAFDVKLRSFCDALRSNNEEVLEVIKASLSSDFVWEVVDFYDARMESGEVQPDRRVPILQGLIHNEQLNGLIGESSSNHALRSTLELQLSDFFAHLESVADSKDFQPWWSPWSRKHTARTSLLESLRCLRYHWSILLVDEQIRASKRQIDSSVRYYINEERGKMFARAKRRWTAGLNHVYSPDNRANYPEAIRVRRQADFARPRESTKIKKCVPTTIESVEAEEVRSSFRKQQHYADHFHKTVQSERSLLIR